MMSFAVFSSLPLVRLERPFAVLCLTSFSLNPVISVLSM